MYRVLVQQSPVKSVLEEMERYNWDPKKDQVLAAYLDENVETLAKRLVSLSVIDEVPLSYPSFQMTLASPVH